MNELIKLFEEASSMLQDAYRALEEAKELSRTGHDLERQAKANLQEAVTEITKAHGLGYGQPDGAIIVGDFAIVCLSMESGEGPYTEHRALPIVKVYSESKESTGK